MNSDLPFKNRSFLSPVEYVFPSNLNSCLNDLFLNEHTCFMTVRENVPSICQTKRVATKPWCSHHKLIASFCKSLLGLRAEQSLRGTAKRQEETGWSEVFWNVYIHIYIHAFCLKLTHVPWLEALDIEVSCVEPLCPPAGGFLSWAAMDVNPWATSRAVSMWGFLSPTLFLTCS